MNHRDLGEPRLRADRTPTICVRCGELLAPGDFHRNNHTSDGRQSWCKKCKKDYANGRVPDVYGAADAREAREVLELMHERGRHEGAPNPRCPRCTA